MSTNDTLAQMPPLTQFDLAIMKALTKNPQGLRYSELHRKSELEYERMGNGKGFNVRTFDKHLKWLVSERALERIVEARYRVYYKLTIPTEIKSEAETSRELMVNLLNKFEKIITEESASMEYLVEKSMDLIGYFVKVGLEMGILMWILESPVYARYWVDEQMETTRYFFNKLVTMLEKRENVKDLRQLFDRLHHKWNEQFKREVGLLR